MTEKKDPKSASPDISGEINNSESDDSGTKTTPGGIKQKNENIMVWKAAFLLVFTLFLISQIFDISFTPKQSIINLFHLTSQAQTTGAENKQALDTSAITQAVLPDSGVTLPITWGDLGQKMIADGVIDETKFRALFENGLDKNEEQLLTGNSNQPVVMNQQNSRYLLDLLWAFGLANKNDILDNGEMTDKQFGGAANFASTGGWTLSRDNAMNHYSHHQYLVLNSQQQALVDSVSRNIYRPCCGNSTHFPDCNHGMAMLGLLELMAKNGASEKQMYDVALKVNSFWFPQTYIDLATYFQEQGQNWNQVDAKTVLSSRYSSAQGYQQTRQQIKSIPQSGQGGSGCGA